MAPPVEGWIFGVWRRGARPGASHPSLAVGLITVGLGVDCIRSSGAAEASALRPSRSTAGTTTAALVDITMSWGSACRIELSAICADTTKANDKLCLSEACRPVHQDVGVAMAFGICPPAPWPRVATSVGGPAMALAISSSPPLAGDHPLLR